jgi:phosphoribosylanthranilate isomerase
MLIIKHLARYITRYNPSSRAVTTGHLGKDSARRRYGLSVAQTSESAVSQVSKPAGRMPVVPTWKSAARQVWKPALRNSGRKSLNGCSRTAGSGWTIAATLPKTGLRPRAALEFNGVVDVKIKICGITSPADAEAAVLAGADALGLMFFPGSPRFISLEMAQDIARRLPPYVLRTGVFADPEPSEVVAAIQHCQLNLLQFHGAETPEFCLQFGLMTMKAFRMKNADSLPALSAYQTDAFLLDSHVAGKPGGTGETFNWDLALEAKKFGKPIFLAGGLTPQNVAEAVRQTQPFGVDVSSGVEQSPGKKDAGKMRDFIAAVRGA